MTLFLLRIAEPSKTTLITAPSSYCRLTETIFASLRPQTSKKKTRRRKPLRRRCKRVSTMLSWLPVGVQYEHLSWESEYFDNASEHVTSRTVKMFTGWSPTMKDVEIFMVSQPGEMMFQRRLRTKWDMPDTCHY